MVIRLGDENVIAVVDRQKFVTFTFKPRLKENQLNVIITLLSLNYTYLD